MAVVLSLTWTGLTPDHYDTLRNAVDWENDQPEGIALHVAWFDAGALHVTDVWNDQANFQRFFAERLMPAIKQAGITGEPEVTFSPMHRRFVASGVSGVG
ncbi:hypothetical protein [Streptomyces sp. NPDC048419]|uniref:hypothetical protein n=1 Tax=Streptomyces sp. NPDC048419 TaxID=3365547 RepID=UPI0037218274